MIFECCIFKPSGKVCAVEEVGRGHVWYDHERDGVDFEVVTTEDVKPQEVDFPIMLKTSLGSFTVPASSISTALVKGGE